MAEDLCELGLKKNPEVETQQQEDYSALRKWQCKIHESKGKTPFKCSPLAEEGKGIWFTE